jgi:valyl-tRNA synthetase
MHHSNVPQSAPQQLSVVNEWIMTKASRCFAEYHKALEQSEFGTALLAVEKFFWHDFCDNYLELIKDQLFKPERYTPEIVDATRWTLYNVGLRILQLYAPYLPYITDALFNALYAQHGNSVHTTKFSDIQKRVEYHESVHELNLILDIVAQVRKLKSEQNLSLKTTIKQLTIIADADGVYSQQLIKKHEQLMTGVLNIESCSYTQGNPTNSIERRENDSWYATVGI